MSPRFGDRPPPTRNKTRTQSRKPAPTPVGAYGCLVVGIIGAVLIVGLAVVFLWDVNLPH